MVPSGQLSATTALARPEPFTSSCRRSAKSVRPWSRAVAVSSSVRQAQAAGSRCGWPRRTPSHRGLASTEERRICRSRVRDLTTLAWGMDSVIRSIPSDLTALILLLQPGHQGLEVLHHGAGGEVLARGFLQHLPPV